MIAKIFSINLLILLVSQFVFSNDKGDHIKTELAVMATAPKYKYLFI